ncbi:MAG: hypothetical protein WCL39_09575 [Armatimonadota bacterium]
MTLRGHKGRLIILICVLGLISPAHAVVNLEWHPATQVVVAGGIASIELHAFADAPAGHVISGMDLIVQNDTARTRLIQIDSSIATYPWLVDGLFEGAPDDLNKNTADGTVLYTAFAHLGFKHPVPGAGITVADFRFRISPLTGTTTVSLLKQTGTLAQSLVFDGVIPDLDILGAMGSATLTVIPVPTIAASIGSAKQHPDGTSVQIHCPVTRTFANEGFFYIEDPKRAAGIRVNTAVGLEPPEGSSQIVTGILATIDGERVIKDSILVEAGPAAIPNPVGIKVDSATNPPGLSPQGLYVRMTGKAEVASAPASSFVLNDGSLTPIRVDLHNATAPPDGDWVEVTGVLGADASGPVVRVNRQLDIRTMAR